MRKRSSYRPREVIRDPLGFVIGGMKPMTEAQIIDCGIKHHQAMYKMTHGEATKHDWEVVCHMINTSAAMSTTIFDSAYLDDIQAAMKAHAKAGRRHYIDNKSFGYTGDELQVVNTALAICDEQLKLATMAEIDIATRVVERALKNKNFFASVLENCA